MHEAVLAQPLKKAVLYVGFLCIQVFSKGLFWKKHIIDNLMYHDDVIQSLIAHLQLGGRAFCLNVVVNRFVQYDNVLGTTHQLIHQQVVFEIAEPLNAFVFEICKQ